MISTRQLGIMISLSRISVMTIFLPVITAANALEDAPLAALLAVLVSLPVVYMLGSLARRLAGEGLVQGAQSALGAPLGKASALLLASFFFALALLRSRQLAFALANSILPQVPTWVVAASMLALGIYGALLGVDSLGRSAEVLITLIGFTILLGLTLTFVSGIADYRMLLPVMTRGMRPLATAAVNPVFWFATSASIVVVFAKYCDEPAGIPTTAVWATAASGVLLIVLAISANTALGPRTAVLSLSPVHTMARTIYYRGVIERLDILAINLWVLGVAFDTALFFLASLTIIGDIFRRVSRSIITAFLAAPGAVLVTLPLADVFAIRRMLSPTVTGGMLLIVHLLLLGGMHLVSIIRQKGDGA